MPELPEVETIVRDLRQKAQGLTIQKVRIIDGRVVRQASEKEFVKRLQGRTLQSVSRRGKAIVIQLNQTLDVRRLTLEKNTTSVQRPASNVRFLVNQLTHSTPVRLGPKASLTVAQGQLNYFVIQLMMTGQLIYSVTPVPSRDTKVTIHLSNGEYLHYNDFRTFGRLQVVQKLDEIPYFSRLGPEPLEKEFTAVWLAKALKRPSPIKPLLLNHQFVAGIGNIYASEILFASQIHPKRRADSLKKEEITVLHRNIRNILKEAIRFRGTSMNTYRDAKGEKGNFIDRIKVYGREEESCFFCSAELVKVVQSGRSTFYCPQCQR